MNKRFLKGQILLRRVLFRLNKNSFLFKKVDLHLRSILEKVYERNQGFYFVQIGANDGVSHDWLYDFVKERNSVGLVIEPLQDFFNLLKANYEYNLNIKPLRFAVHSELNEISLFRVHKDALAIYPDWAGGIASVSHEHLQKSGLIDPSYIVEEKVPARHLMDILNSFYPYNQIDLFQIDTEGYDWEILKMLDFAQYKPSFFKIEYVNLSGMEIENMLSLFKRNRYLTFYEGSDLIAVKV